MRSVVMEQGRLSVREHPRPEAGPGQLLVEPLACGICGSDLGAWKHTAEFLQASRDSGTDLYIFDPRRPLVMGHEFSGRVLEVGDDVSEYSRGDVIAALPVVTDSQGLHRVVGYATEYPGAFSQRTVVNAAGQVKVPRDFSPVLAAMTEPMHVGFGDVLGSGIGAGDPAVVIGCGPVGLGAVAALAELGCEPIVASDFSRLRRKAAVNLGAHLSVDPRSTDAIDALRAVTDEHDGLVVFNAVGARGVISSLFYTVPPGTRIRMLGSVMVDDVFRPVVGTYKGLSLEFGPKSPPGAFAAVLERIVDGRLDVAPLITGVVGLEGVPAAFEALRPDKPANLEHVKIIVRHDLAGAMIYEPTDDLLAGSLTEG